MNATREHGPVTGVLAASALVGLGGILLGLQVDKNGALSGTGFVALGIGALLALAASLLRLRSGERMPRDTVGMCASVASFVGLATLFAGVIAPGGSWMFFEVFLLAGLGVWRKPKAVDGAWIGGGTLVLLASLLLFRLWISYQGSEYRWQLLSIPVPILAWIPFDFLAPIQSISLGSFTPRELGFPPAGLDFATTLVLWSLGFAACAGGLVWLQNAAREHENDRIHALLCTLPSEVAAIVERILPEEQWHATGLHGLSERRLAKRIEMLVAERVRQQRDLQRALDTSQRLTLTNPGGFSGGILQALDGPGIPPAPRD